MYHNDRVQISQKQTPLLNKQEERWLLTGSGRHGEWGLVGTRLQTFNPKNWGSAKTLLIEGQADGPHYTFTIPAHPVRDDDGGVESVEYCSLFSIKVLEQAVLSISERAPGPDGISADLYNIGQPYCSSHSTLT